MTGATRSKQARRTLEGLVAVLEDSSELAARAAVVEDWFLLVDTAFDQGMGGLLLHSLERSGVRVPEDVASSAESILARDRLWYRKLWLDLERVQLAFDSAGVRAVTLKGPVLAERMYPEPALRPSGDLDFLVDPEQMEGGVRALKSLDCRIVPETCRGHHVVFESPAGTQIELHDKASSYFATTLSAAPVVERSVGYRTRSGVAVGTLDPVDEALFLSVHACRHRFTRLGWLWEVGVSLSRLGSEEWAQLLERARQERAGRALALSRLALEQWLDWAPGGPASRVHRDARLRFALHLARLAHGPEPRIGGLVFKSYRFVCHQTYQALLGETSGEGLRFFLRTARLKLRDLVGT